MPPAFPRTPVPFSSSQQIETPPCRPFSRPPSDKLDVLPAPFPSLFTLAADLQLPLFACFSHLPATLASSLKCASSKTGDSPFASNVPQNPCPVFKQSADWNASLSPFLPSAVRQARRFASPVSFPFHPRCGLQLPLFICFSFHSDYFWLVVFLSATLLSCGLLLTFHSSPSFIFSRCSSFYSPMVFSGAAFPPAFCRPCRGYFALLLLLVFLTPSRQIHFTVPFMATISLIYLQKI